MPVSLVSTRLGLRAIDVVSVSSLLLVASLVSLLNCKYSRWCNHKLLTLFSAEGWAYDRNNINYDVPIDVLVNGQLYASGLANLASPVVNRVHNITGAHAFRIPLNVTAYGTHTVTAVSTINGRRRPLMGSFEISNKYPRGQVRVIT